jgi:2-polyprenyl-3-methyl-5-hydroxy-6-metoxy-1,4-benzoquinol methylase
MANQIISPITGKTNITVLENIDCNTIIQQYKDDYKLDVSRSLNGVSHVSICQCNDSGFRFYAPDSVAGDEQFYLDFQEALGEYYKPWRWEYTQCLNMLKKQDKVLEIGTGSGNFFEKLNEVVENPVGLELSNMAIERAKAKGLNVINELIEVHAQKHENTYDVVCFFQVLEHISDVKSFLESAIKCLKPNGKLVIAVPNNNPHFYRYEKYYTSNLPPHHAGLWDKETFEKLVEYFPMDKVTIKTEPLFGIVYQLKVWLKYENHRFLEKIVNKTPHWILRKLGIFNPFFEGVNIFAVFKKR